MGGLSSSNFARSRCSVRTRWEKEMFNSCLFVMSVNFYRQPSSSDEITSMNQTNLALKGIIGIGAMARISSFMGMNDDASSYEVRLMRQCIDLS